MKQLSICLYAACLLLLVACKKDDYKNDGGVHNPNVNMTTYDYLKSKPGQFSKLVYLIDKTGLKDVVNGNITLFAVTDYGVNDYVLVRRARKVKQTNNENLVYTIDSLPAAEMKDSLRIYMFNGKINRDQMSRDGVLYDGLMGPWTGVKFMIRLRRSNDYSQYLPYVDYVNFTKVNGSRDEEEPDPDNIPKELRDISFDCQTSGIVTTTGIIHVLSGSHVLMFNGQ
jgi:hypothetical protein